MIALRSTDGGLVFQVYDDEKLIGHIHKKKGKTGDRYLASTERVGQEDSNGKEFDSPDDALRWIERHQ